MVINDTAYYKGKIWCAYDLKKRDGTYNEELRLVMRKESQSNQFQCPDCGENLILCAGPIMEPFFKHHEDSNCISYQRKGTKTNLLARRILYQLAKASFPSANLLWNPKIADKATPTILVELEGTKIALEYLGYERKLADWEAEHTIYQENGIIDVWFLNHQRYLDDRITTFEYLLMKIGVAWNLLDFTNQKLILKSMKYIDRAQKEVLVTKSYDIEDMLIDEKGEVICDFIDYRNGTIDGILKELQEKVRLEGEERQEREQERKRFEESQKKFEETQMKLEEEQKKREEETMRQEIEYREYQRKLDEEIEQRRRAEIKRRQEEYQRREQETSARMESNQPLGARQEQIFQATEGKVIRRDMSGELLPNRTMKMASIQELWDIPDLKGKDWSIRKGNTNRYLYLKHLNKTLGTMSDSQQQQEAIEEAIKILEKNTQSTQWG